MKQTLILAATLLALTTAAGYAATTQPAPPPGYHYGLGNHLVADCVTGCRPPPSGTSGGKTSVSFPACTADGANVGNTTVKSSASSSSKSARHLTGPAARAAFPHITLSSGETNARTMF